MKSPRRYNRLGEYPKGSLGHSVQTNAWSVAFCNPFVSVTGYLNSLASSLVFTGCCYLDLLVYLITRYHTPPKIEKPPSTHIIAPVTNCDASLSNQTSAPFNSSGWPKRLNG